MFEKISFAVYGFDNALVFEFGVGFGDGVAVDAELFGKRAESWERFAGFESAGSGGEADLISQLEVNWFAGVKIDFKQHRQPLCYCHTTVGQYVNS
ncbi:hypothetical protein SDC9_211115 [bioreactor metagenome]|uniref:Uncharacterized protein n=1 Tax=bioreactor metagenome TaxID=1076179 RepID=A0A645JJ36_9ZZZZ